MLWYVEQTVPDPTCTATGTATCPTITALMPQVYLPSDTSAMSAGGNITGTDVTLNFGKGDGGSVLNTGSITASDTLTVNTDSLTNQANQVNVGQIWSSVKGGYIDTTGTTVQPGGFMSAANMDLNVQTLNQIGGALQKLNADGTVDQAGTQALLTQLQQELGGNFTQTSVSDNLHTDFVKQGGGLPTFVVAAIAIAASIVTAGGAAAAMGVVMTQLSVGSVLVGALGGMVGSIAGQLASGQGLNFGQILEAGALGGLTAGAFAATGLGNVQSLQTLGNTIGSGSSVTASEFGSELGSALKTIVERGVVTAGLDTAVYGGSFGKALESSIISDVGMVGAGAIGTAGNDDQSFFAKGGAGYVLAHAGLGCALSAAEGSGCAGGAIGGAASALASPLLLGAIDPNHNVLTTGQTAALGAFATLVGGLSAGLAGANAQGGAQAGQNVALNNDAPHWGLPSNQAQAGLPGQQGGSTNGSSLIANPFTSAGAAACAGGLQPCNMQVFQAAMQAQGVNSDQALANMQTAAPYVGGTLGVALLGPEALTAAVLAGGFDYEGDAVSYAANLSKDPPSFTKSYIAGVVGGLTYPFGITDEAIAGMGTAGKIAANGYNAVVTGTGAFGAAAITHQDSPDASAGFGAGSAAFGGAVKSLFPGSVGNFLNNMIQGLAGPFQNAVMPSK